MVMQKVIEYLLFIAFCTSMGVVYMWDYLNHTYSGCKPD